jgi:hypothetical protein
MLGRHVLPKHLDEKSVLTPPLSASRLSYCGVGRPFRAGMPEKPSRNVRPVTGETFASF